MPAKTITVEAASQTGALVFSQTVEGKKHKARLMREALNAVSPTGGVIRYQTHGARDWARWTCAPGASEALPDQRAVWPLQ